MKISFECECILLQKTLLLFCKNEAAHHKDCDFVVSDRHINTQKPLFLISDDSPYLSVPFSKQTLLNTLEEFYSAIQIKQSNFDDAKSEVSLEGRIGELVDSFKKELIELLRSRA
ncbi:MAG: hypothetical protein ACFNUJ_04100 [Campylobacter curvus]